MIRLMRDTIIWGSQLYIYAFSYLLICIAIYLFVQIVILKRKPPIPIIIRRLSIYLFSRILGFIIICAAISIFDSESHAATNLIAQSFTFKIVTAISVFNILIIAPFLVLYDSPQQNRSQTVIASFLWIEGFIFTFFVILFCYRVV